MSLFQKSDEKKYLNDLDSILGYKRFKYDGSNNLLEEEYWYKRWYSDDRKKNL